MMESPTLANFTSPALQRVPRRRVGFGEVEEVRIDLRAEPVIAFEELRRVTWQRHDLMLLLRYRVTSYVLLSLSMFAVC